LYSTLSKYVHSTYEELEPAVKKGRVDARVLFAFDPELFEKCVELTNRAIDSVFFLALNRVPEFAATIKKQPRMLNWLKELKSELFEIYRICMRSTGISASAPLAFCPRAS